MLLSQHLERKTWSLRKGSFVLKGSLESLEALTLNSLASLEKFGFSFESLEMDLSAKNLTTIHKCAELCVELAAARECRLPGKKSREGALRGLGGRAIVGGTRAILQPYQTYWKQNCRQID